MSVTVRAVLFGDTDPVVALGRSRGWQGVVGGLGATLGAISSDGRSMVERELSRSVVGLLDLDLGAMVVGGWRRHRALIAAAHATETDPAASEVVQLATHRIAATHRPYVDVVVNGVKLVTIHFDLGVTFDVDNLAGTVRRAHLVALHGGRCLTTVGLGCEGRELASRQVTLDLPMTVRLGDGIALLQEERRSAPA